MTGCVVGTGTEQVRERAGQVMRRSGKPGTVEEWLAAVRGEWVVGTVGEVVDHLRQLEDAGVQRVMLQHLVHDDLESVRLLGEVASEVASGAG
jgi:alkanesulfonate monooxygenase SsuD/methylene tetrahydromethanopterin reductase-like flavin-dependent oxidoreductase (luciferase family)